ncbi:F0F1 ATP synthase subunit B [Clostridium botulinum]|uniref:F0F1 ATP synthase subunit B n=1 Tax=Clostridium botulinum TaxID=1491 RepID=UPI0004D5506E|nr:F0F1 ATP synthase subunit B [Clostridium botulinum]KEI00305.1 ATP F0F1 synthase subunit B [Clostridium botulinum C/D str. BKT75002]KEI08926.1 ATP F0F1 synthase subunit B [Clostridium botulinum C/D str. BKT2873]KGM93839.1 ATP F0F1 synthase subunit B [Clostridium botulinum D str. CCUG 7971]KOC51180.1 ATP F0F1 synthase subunit B [Clostridium botulinum]MCD3350899.1 F0F1 ATP synthase subunit B [Clostridium botulinum D/C]
MEFTISTFVWTIINFLVLLGILSYFLFKPVNLVIDRRNSEIENDINQAKTDKEKAEELRIANQKEYKAAKKEGKTIVENYKAKAENVSQEIISDAHKEAELIIQRAKKEIQREREKAEDEVKNKTIELALELSKKALEQSIDEKVHRELIDNFISKVGN